MKYIREIYSIKLLDGQQFMTGKDGVTLIDTVSPLFPFQNDDMITIWITEGKKLKPSLMFSPKTIAEIKFK